MQRKNIKPKVYLLFDFDGTLTGVPGQRLVVPREDDKQGQEYKAFYHSLLTAPKEGDDPDDYRRDMLKPEVVQKTIREGYADGPNGERDPRRITADAVAFFKELLSNEDEEIQIAFFTKNQQDYLLNMFAVEGLPAANVKIFDSGFKCKDVSTYLTDIDPASQVFGFDDSEHDAAEIEKGAKKHCNNVKVYNKLPGQFDWKTYLEAIKQAKSDLNKKAEEAISKSNPEAPQQEEKEPSSPQTVDKGTTLTFQSFPDAGSEEKVPENTKASVSFQDSKEDSDSDWSSDNDMEMEETLSKEDEEKLSVQRWLRLYDVTHMIREHGRTQGFNLHGGFGKAVEGSDIKYSTSAANLLNQLPEFFNPQQPNELILDSVYQSALQFIKRELEPKQQPVHHWWNFFHIGERDPSTAQLYRDILDFCKLPLGVRNQNLIVEEDNSARRTLACQG